MSRAERSARCADKGAATARTAKMAVKMVTGAAAMRRAIGNLFDRRKCFLSVCIAIILALRCCRSGGSHLLVNFDFIQDCTINSAGDGEPAEISPIVMAAARSMAPDSF